MLNISVPLAREGISNYFCQRKKGRRLNRPNAETLFIAFFACHYDSDFAAAFKVKRETEKFLFHKQKLKVVRTIFGHYARAFRDLQRGATNAPFLFVYIASCLNYFTQSVYLSLTTYTRCKEQRTQYVRPCWCATYQITKMLSGIEKYIVESLRGWNIVYIGNLLSGLVYGARAGLAVNPDCGFGTVNGYGVARDLDGPVFVRMSGVGRWRL